MHVTRNLSKYKTLIVGGGSGGLAMTQRFAKHHTQKFQTALVEPNPYHYYQPLWTLVGGGKKPLTDSVQPLEKFLPFHVRRYHHSVESFSPENNSLTLSTGQVLEYENLVVALGIDLKFDKIPGFQDALDAENPQVCTNYHYDYCSKTFQALNNLVETAKSNPTQKYTAIFTQPNTPIKCAGAPQKIVYLAEEFFRKHQVRDQIDMKFYTGMPGIFGVAPYAVVMRGLMADKNVEVVYENNLESIDVDNNTANFSKIGATQFDFMHVTPPQGPLDVIKNSSLADSVGWVDVNKHTLQHNQFKNVWALGDCSSLPTSKTAAAIASQNKILFDNMLAVEKNPNLETEKFPGQYDGYASCPLVVGDDKGMIAEFDYELKRLETLPLDQRKPSRLMYKMKADWIPQIYWTQHVFGRWNGPAVFRKILDPFGSFLAAKRQ